MQLRDYLHHYIGCKVRATPYGGQSNRWEEGRIVGLNIHNVAHVKVDHWQSIADVSIACIKPILHRLEDMTEEEAAHLALIYSGAKKVIPTKGVATNWHYFFCYFGEETEAETLIISADGCAWYAHYFDKSQSGCRNIVNEHFATHYLLQQHFDLFGLIDAGLAVDAKTMNS